MNAYDIATWLVQMPQTRHKQVKRAYRTLRVAGVEHEQALTILHDADMKRQQWEADKKHPSNVVYAR